MHFLRKARAPKVFLAALLAAIVGLGVFEGLATAQKKNNSKRRRRAIQREMESPYKRWLREEVPHIITGDERKTFTSLSTDEEREQFIEQFWERRNPSPGSPENEFREEYYRRIAYANERFQSGWPGWKTDRGRIYIMYGPPDERETHPTGGRYDRPYEEGGGSTTTYPWERWRYRYIDGIGTNIELEFVDPTSTGEYRLAISPAEKDALTFVPGGGLTQDEQMGLSSKAQRRPGMGIGSMEPAGGYRTRRLSQFDRLDLYSRIFKPPSVKFRDLQAVVSSRLTANLLPFQVRTDYIKITSESILTPITIQMANRDLQFEETDGVMQAVVSIYGQLTTLGGRVAEVFEDAVQLDVPVSIFDQYVHKKSVYQKAIPLRPGRYKLSIVLKDEKSENMGSMEVVVPVRRFEDEELSASSLILATKIGPLPTSRMGSGPFVIGASKVRPSVDSRFANQSEMGIYLVVYNLGLAEKGGKPEAEIEYKILKDGKTVMSASERVPEDYPNTRSQLTIQKKLPLGQLEPGRYSLQVEVTDQVKSATLNPSASFEVY
jgi:GWxTD domain-containing protein